MIFILFLFSTLFSFGKKCSYPNSKSKKLTYEKS